jgi:hypothetical protein
LQSPLKVLNLLPELSASVMKADDTSRDIQDLRQDDQGARAVAAQD